jgi:hypothetical protein
MGRQPLVLVAVESGSLRLAVSVRNPSAREAEKLTHANGDGPAFNLIQNLYLV